MPMDSATKQQLSAELRAKIEDVDALVLVGFSGLTVADANALRGKFREAGCTYQVYKNSTVRFATEGTKHEPIKELLKGVCGLAYNGDDPGAPARVARDFAKDHEELTVKGGVIDGSLLDDAGIETLANMPGPRELKAQLLALLNTPATQMVRVLNAPAQSFLYLLNAKQDKDAA
ncbi:MAG: 50S ribosomal protein L10 [Myxococcota bacterium]